jgi:hypothetical protein
MFYIAEKTMIHSSSLTFCTLAPGTIQQKQKDHNVSNQLWNIYTVSIPPVSDCSRPRRMIVGQKRSNPPADLEAKNSRIKFNVIRQLAAVSPHVGVVNINLKLNDIGHLLFRIWEELE